MYTIEVENISKNFGKHTAVDQVSFEVKPGEIFGLLGPNGAGKTTSIRIILDIFKPDRGKVTIFGGPMEEFQEKSNRVSAGGTRFIPGFTFGALPDLSGFLERYGETKITGKNIKLSGPVRFNGLPQKEN